MLVGKGVYSLAGGFSHSAVLFDEPPELKNVRAKALRTIAAKKTKTVFGTTRDVGYVVWWVVLVKHDDRRQRDTHLHSCQRCVWGSVHSEQKLFEQFLVWFFLRLIRSKYTLALVSVAVAVLGTQRYT